LSAELKTITEVKKKLEKKYKDAVTELFPVHSSKVSVIPTGSIIMDMVTGLGGIPRGRITELYGPYSTGKTTIAITTMIELQKMKNTVALYLDYEHAFDSTYAHHLGLDLNPDRLVFCQPESFEQGHAVIDEFVESGVVDLIVIDSAAAMTPQEELEGAVDASGRIGLQAQLMARMLNRVTKKLGRGRQPAFLILNQMRTKIDTTSRRGTRDEAAGGNAMKFYTTLKLELQQMEREGDENRGKPGTDQVYTKTLVRVVCTKNKLAAPYLRGKLTIEYGEGINNIVSVADLAESHLGVMSGAGFFKYTGDNPGTSFSCRGRSEFHRLLSSNPKLLQELEKKLFTTVQAMQSTNLGLRPLPTKEEEETIVIGEQEKSGSASPEETQTESS